MSGPVNNDPERIIGRQPMTAPTPREALADALQAHRDLREPPCKSCIGMAALTRSEPLDVEVLADAMYTVRRNRDWPAMTNREETEAIAAEYARLEAADKT